jgi:hypothetical protein
MCHDVKYPGLADVLDMYYGVRSAWYDPWLNYCQNVSLMDPAYVKRCVAEHPARQRQLAEMFRPAQPVDQVERLKELMVCAVRLSGVR